MVYFINNVLNVMNELKIEIIVAGDSLSNPVESGDKVTVHYTGMLLDGKVFDSSVGRGTPFTTHIGVGRVIQGWDEGIVGMYAGEKRRLTIPYTMAYGERGVPGAIPAKADLVFDVELISIG